MELPELGISLEVMVTPSWSDKIVDERDIARCNHLRTEYALLRQDMGAAAATETWFTPILDQWLAWLEDVDGDVLDYDTNLLCKLAVSATISLSMRDALIIGLVAQPQYWDRSVLIDFAAHPHAPNTSKGMYRILRQEFTGTAQPDHVRIAHGLEILERAAYIVPDHFSAQLLAMAAYAAWWDGNQDAAQFATDAMALDDDATLAGVVIAAILQGIQPGWMRARAQHDEACDDDDRE